MDIVEANKLVRPLRDVFDQRFSEWGLREALDQCRKGFPLLKRIKSTMVHRMLHHFDSLAGPEREELLKAARKNADAHGASMQLTREESNLFDSLRQSILMPAPDENLDLSLEDSRRLFKLNKKILREEINKVLTPLFGSSPERWGPQEWRYTSIVKDWKVYTFIDIGGKSQLRYGHKVGICEHVYLREFIDLQAWMGLGHTTWDQITNVEIAEAAHGLREICAHFMVALPGLLDGLTPPMSMKDISAPDSGSAVPRSLLS